MTDNKNRLASEMRIAINKRGGTIATPGAVAFNFDRKGILQIKKSGVDEDALFLAATEAGAHDFEAVGEDYVITTDPVDLYSIKEAVEKLGCKCEEASLEMIPKSFVECDAETAASNQALIN